MKGNGRRRGGASGHTAGHRATAAAPVGVTCLLQHLDADAHRWPHSNHAHFSPPCDRTNPAGVAQYHAIIG